jgi:hypothetical protein
MQMIPTKQENTIAIYFTPSIHIYSKKWIFWAPKSLAYPFGITFFLTLNILIL